MDNGTIIEDSLWTMSTWQETFKAFWIFILIVSLSISLKTLTDNRCYLENGASSETFFVSEDLLVGGVIGQLHVLGDPTPIVGSVALRLKEPDSPVTIAPGSKNLTLRNPLDKEGIEGPSSVFVNLICERIGSMDPGFVIPINIRVTDANDNSPVFINSPYVLNISEVTVVGTRVLQGVQAIDNDQQGPFSSIKYFVRAGPHSDFFAFENELEGTLVLKKPLDYEALKTFDVTICAQDHGSPPKSADTVLTVYVMDADDQNPRFLDNMYTAIIPKPPMKGSGLTIKPRNIRAFDQDEGIDAPISYTWNGVGSEYSLFRIGRQTGLVSLAKNLYEHDLQHAATLVIRASQQDNPDRYALATLTISRKSSKGIRFLQAQFDNLVSEILTPGKVIMTLANNRPREHLKYFVSDQNILKTFAINTLGELSLKEKLDYEEKQEYIFKVFATDGKTNDSTIVNITVENINEWEPRFRYPHYEFFANYNGIFHDLVGRIEVADGDRGDQLTLSLSGPDSSMFFISPTGEIKLRDVKGFQKRTAFLRVTATDSGDPPKQASVPVTIHFPGNKGGNSLASVMSTLDSPGAPILLACLGILLLLLSFLVALLVVYICKVRRSSRQGAAETANVKNFQKQHQMSKPVSNSGKGRPCTAISVGGALSESEMQLSSSKMHPAPQPPVSARWPTVATRFKKLSWQNDKIQSDSAENVNVIDDTSKVLENSNLTVYF